MQTKHDTSKMKYTTQETANNTQIICYIVKFYCHKSVIYFPLMDANIQILRQRYHWRYVSTNTDKDVFYLHTADKLRVARLVCIPANNCYYQQTDAKKSI